MGHLPTLAATKALFPADAIKVYLFGYLVEKFGRNGALYLDLWPFAEPFLVITNPLLAGQIMSNFDIGKSVMVYIILFSAPWDKLTLDEEIHGLRFI